MEESLSRSSRPAVENGGRRSHSAGSRGPPWRTGDGGVTQRVVAARRGERGTEESLSGSSRPAVENGGRRCARAIW